MKTIKVVLFDKDGVLIDSLKNGIHAYNSMLIKFGKRPLSRGEFIRKVWGPALEVSMKRYFGKISRKKMKEASDYYWDKRVEFQKYVKIYPSIKMVLRKLRDRGYKTGVITSTKTSAAKKILKQTDLSKYFDVVIGGDTVRPKPAPDPILKACRIIGVEPSEAAYIGDNKEDVMSGKSAGCLAIAITTYHTKKYFKNADIIIKDIKEVLDLV